MKAQGTVPDQSGSSDHPKTDGIIVMGLCGFVERVHKAGGRASFNYLSNRDCARTPQEPRYALLNAASS